MSFSGKEGEEEEEDRSRAVMFIDSWRKRVSHFNKTETETEPETETVARLAEAVEFVDGIRRGGKFRGSHMIRCVSLSQKLEVAECRLRTPYAQ